MDRANKVKKLQSEEDSTEVTSKKDANIWSKLDYM